MLAALIRLSGVVVQSRGAIALDAIAQDKPVISINFDGDLELVCDADTFALENTYHHYAPLVEAGGVEIVSSYEELIESIATFIETPNRGSEGRKRVLEDHLAPLDGRAAERLVECLQQFGRESVADSEN